MNFVSNNIRRMKDLYQFLKLFRKRYALKEVTNQNTMQRVEQDAAYKRLETEFGDLILSGAKAEGESVKSDKVWICWLQGEENAPDLVKACINSVRRNLPDREIIILSEQTIPEYIQLPEHIIKKWENKSIGPAHYCDVLRIALLCKYGGMWIDATVLCTSTDVPKAITESPLFVFQAMDLARRDVDSVVASNWFLACWSNHPIMLLTRDLLYEYWRRYDRVIDYFIFHAFFALATRRYPEEWQKVPVFNNHSPHVLQYELRNQYDEERWNDIMKMSVFHKLNHHLDLSNMGDSFYKYIIENYS